MQIHRDGGNGGNRRPGPVVARRVAPSPVAGVVRQTTMEPRTSADDMSLGDWLSGKGEDFGGSAVGDSSFNQEEESASKPKHSPDDNADEAKKIADDDDPGMQRDFEADEVYPYGADDPDSSKFDPGYVKDKEAGLVE